MKRSPKWEGDCEDSGSGTPITNYGSNASSWTTLSGAWISGRNDFAPRFYVALENVSAGSAWIRNISLKEDLGGGKYGPELFRMASQQYETYVPHQAAFAFDKILALAEANDIYIKLVLVEKDDYIYKKLDDDGTWVIGGETDNADGVYGQGRTLNKTRWIQQAWWRYVQARWGYSTSIHSWELMNEGDPNRIKHHQMADEFGKYLRCRVFGQEIGYSDSEECTYQHPNRHMVTTSFWFGWPANFWGHSNYPNLDYADVHAYIPDKPRGRRDQSVDGGRRGLSASLARQALFFKHSNCQRRDGNGYRGRPAAAIGHSTRHLRHLVSQLAVGAGGAECHVRLVLVGIRHLRGLLRSPR